MSSYRHNKKHSKHLRKKRTPAEIYHDVEEAKKRIREVTEINKRKLLECGVILDI